MYPASHNLFLVVRSNILHYIFSGKLDASEGYVLLEYFACHFV